MPPQPIECINFILMPDFVWKLAENKAWGPWHYELFFEYFPPDPHTCC